MIVPVQIGPNGGVGVEKFAPASVAQDGALAGRDDNRLAPQPVAHLREGMPDVFLVELREFIHGRLDSISKVFNALVRVETCLAVCTAERVTRSRAAPRATAG